jgi:hypothetical protein
MFLFSNKQRCFVKLIFAVLFQGSETLACSVKKINAAKVWRIKKACKSSLYACIIRTKCLFYCRNKTLFYLFIKNCI